MKKVLLLALLVSCAHKAPVQQPFDPWEKIMHDVPADLKVGVSCSLAYGWWMWGQDRSAWLGSDELTAHTTKEERAQARLGGYVVTNEVDEHGVPTHWDTVWFHDRDYQVIYKAHVPDTMRKRPTFEKLAHPEKSEAVEILGKIRAAAILATYKQFTQQPNPMVFAAGCLGTGNEWAVEMLTSTVKPNTVALGKHLRVLVKNVQVESIKQLSDDEEISMVDEKGKPLASLSVKSDVADYPLEIHVFESLSNRIPIYVTTPRGRWLVDLANVTFLGK